MWKQFFTAKIVSLFLISLLISCNFSNLTPTAEQPARADFRVAILLPQAVNDGDWAQLGYEGLQLIAKQLGAEVAYTDNTDLLPQAEVEQLFRQYAADGFDLIVGHGGQFKAPIKVVAAEFLNSKFAVVGGDPGNNKNLGALGFRSNELGYLMGVVAALKSKTHKVGIIAGEPIPDIVDLVKLFERGAKATDASIELSIAWVNSWKDPQKAKLIAEEMIADGVDVIATRAGDGNFAVFEVASSASGVYVIGGPQDHYDRAPDIIITSGIQRVPVLLLQGAILVRQGRWQGKQYRFGLADGAQELAPFRGKLTPEQEATLKAVTRDIISGKIDVSP